MIKWNYGFAWVKRKKKKFNYNVFYSILVLSKQVIFSRYISVIRIIHYSIELMDKLVVFLDSVFQGPVKILLIVSEGTEVIVVI